MSNLTFAEIPIPPSTNAIWAIIKMPNGQPRLGKSAAYKRWKAGATRDLAVQLRTIKPGNHVRIFINVHGGKGWPSNRDISNAVKPVEDALVEAGVLPDDNCKIVRCIVCRFIEPPGPSYRAKITVAIETMEAPI